MSSLGFSFLQDNETVVFYRHGNEIKRIKGLSALKFMEFIRINSDDKIQTQIAKLTGNYKRGNERKARDHPRNKSNN